MSKTHKRIAIVTGTTSGIGEATMRKFVAEGFGVVGNGRKAKKLAELEDEIGPAFCCVAGDAGDDVVLEKLFAKARERFGREADIVVANAGRGLGGSVKDADLSHFDDMMKTNVKGVALLIQKAARRMVAMQEKAFPESAADIVIIGSVAGRQISPFSAVYSASKFAVHALAESLRREVGPAGVRVSLVEPGALASGFQAAAGYSDETVNILHEKFGPLLVGDDIADTVYHIVTQPPHIHISDIIVRPTRMDYP
jgi:NADP-dependent 3-hydroxy acid dehydrogenase YdfG